MDVISKAWERLQSRLKDRQNSLTSMTDLSSNFQDTLGSLTLWLTEFNDVLNALTPVVACSDNQYQLTDETKVN